MTLSEQAESYADDMMKGNRGDVFCRVDLHAAYAEAYAQGWIDRDTQGEVPESEEEFMA